MSATLIRGTIMEEPWQADGLRYVVSLQDVKDTSLYKDIFETNKHEEAKRKADDAVAKNNRSVIIFDRKNPLDSQRIKVENGVVAKEEEAVLPKTKKKAEPKAQVEPKFEKPSKKIMPTADDLFD